VTHTATLTPRYVFPACLESIYMCFGKNPLLTYTISKQGKSSRLTDAFDLDHIRSSFTLLEHFTLMEKW